MNFDTQCKRALALATLALLAAFSAQAQVVTIDQNKALAGNVTPYDAPGFPVNIWTPGTYRLTSNLVVPAGTVGIRIDATNVTIDLNGFSIIGPVVCSGAGAALACSGVLQGNGIEAAGDGFVLRNGTVRGFGGAGVTTGQEALIDRVTSRSNGAMGFYLYDYGTVTNSLASDNGGDGFTLGNGSLVTSSRAVNNKGDGISMDDDATAGEVRDSFAARNGKSQFAPRGGPSSWIGNTAVAPKSGFCFGIGGKLIRNNVCDGVAVK